MSETTQKMSFARERAIVELAEAVADQHFATQRVEPEVVLARKRITLSFGYYGSAFDGMIEFKRGRFHVYGNLDRLKSERSSRARFTLGHELGHYYIDEHRRALESGRVGPHQSICEFESGLLAEREADLFAANLLLPPSRFAAAAARTPVGLSSVLALAERFGTSITSTAIAYVKADAWPSAVIKWSASGYAWRWISDSFRASGLRHTIDRTSDVPRDSATAMALLGVAAPICGYFERGGTASYWFPRGGARSDLLVMEQAVRLGEYGALTFLYPLDS